MRGKKELSKIYIRARINDEWGSYSLQEILDKKSGGQIVEWFFSKIGLVEGAIVDEKVALHLLDILERLGIKVSKVV